MRIAFGGEMASGKTTYAEILEEEFGFTHLALGDQVKRIADAPLGEVPVLVEDTLSAVGQEGQRNRVSLLVYEARERYADDRRRMLQTIGTEIGRSVDPNLWVRWLLVKLEAHMPGVEDVVVSDIRFREEFDVLGEAGFFRARILTSERIRRERVRAIYGETAEEAFQHDSERMLARIPFEDWDFVVSGEIDLSYAPAMLGAMVDLARERREASP